MYYEFRMQFVAYFSLYNHFVVPRKDKVIDVKLQGENSIQPKPNGILCFLYFCPLPPPPMKSDPHQELQHRQTTMGRWEQGREKSSLIHHFQPPRKSMRK